MSKLGFVLVGCLVGSALLSGCQKEATGQVAAVVNDEEVTLQEINTELGQSQIPEGANKERVQQAALQRIVERRLLAQAAREDGLLRARWRAPSPHRRSRHGGTHRFCQRLDSNPGQRAAVFGGRAILNIDRIQFPMPSDPSTLRQLEGDHSMDAVAATLQRLGIQFSRGNAQMDSAVLGQERLNRIRALPAGEPFVIPEGRMVTVAVITGETAQPVQGDRARPTAAWS